MANRPWFPGTQQLPRCDEPPTIALSLDAASQVTHIDDEEDDGRRQDR